jgi:hypothetical protein
VVADVNGDGRPDLITANYASNNVSVLLGSAYGSFQASRPFAVGNHPFRVAVADLGNGHLDIVTANAGDNNVSVLLGDGHGSFQLAQTLAVGDYPTSVAVADLGNGHMDIVTANGISDTVSVLLGDGHGSFQPHSDFPVGSNPQSIAVTDVNGDGTPDIVTANYKGNDVSVLLGSGNGAFVPTGLFVPLIPAHFAEAALLDTRSTPTSLTPILSPAQLPSVALAFLSNAPTSGSNEPKFSESSGQGEGNFESLPDLLVHQPEPILPTERDILEHMDSARLLPTWHRPRVNLAAQRDTVVAFGVLTGDPSAGAAPKSGAGKGNRKHWHRVPNEPVKGSEDLRRDEGGVRSKPVATPSSQSTNEERDEAKNHLLTLPLLLPFVGQLICWLQGPARVRQPREQHLPLPENAPARGPLRAADTEEVP